MNIFEALKIGMGKATLPGYIDFVSYTDKDGIFWSCRPPIISTVTCSQIKRDDWIPYVSPEERKIEGMVNFVPRETCFSCGQVIPPKRERKVIVRVKWKTVDGKTIVYPVFQGFGVDYQSFPSKPEMKMTLEWEE